MDSTADDGFSIRTDADVAPQPLGDDDSSVDPDAPADPAQEEWERTIALDEGTDPDDLDAATATGDDPAQIPTDEDQIPATDLPGGGIQPESQGDDPLIAELGEDGEGDLSPEDL
jgi:hypothetical protein